MGHLYFCHKHRTVLHNKVGGSGSLKKASVGGGLEHFATHTHTGSFVPVSAILVCATWFYPPLGPSAHRRRLSALKQR